MSKSLRQPSAFIPEDERDWWHAETWEEAARALRDHYPMGCAVDTCSAATERKSHFCARHADFMDRVARSGRVKTYPAKLTGLPNPDEL